MRWTVVSVVLLFFLGLGFSRCGGDSNVIDTVACPILPAVAKIAIADDYFNRKVQLKTRLFYNANQVRRAWLRENRPDKMFIAFAKEVKESYRYGFDPEDYHIAELETAVEELFNDRKKTNADISNLDIRITASFFLFTTHLIEGRIRFKGAREFFWEKGMPLENDIAILLKMESAPDLRQELGALHPDDPQYEKLQKALADYRNLIQRDSSELMAASVNESPGKIRSKVAVISLNLERLRWYPHMRGEGDEIVINVPEFMLRVYHNRKEKMKMRVVLGAEYSPTPVFHDTLKYIVFSPTWMVPYSIFKNEFYPRLREDPEHFDPERFSFFKDDKEIDPKDEDWTDKKFDISKYSVMEKPGDANALGQVKFIMPNDFSIYLHDTPADQLFQQESRALSHGCIRLEKPLELAEYLLSDKKGWNAERITEAMESGKPLKIDLDKPYPVYIVYRTAWVNDDGQVQFAEDIYGHDKRQLARLK